MYRRTRKYTAERLAAMKAGKDRDRLARRLKQVTTKDGVANVFERLINRRIVALDGELATLDASIALVAGAKARLAHYTDSAPVRTTRRDPMEEALAGVLQQARERHWGRRG